MIDTLEDFLQTSEHLTGDDILEVFQECTTVDLRYAILGRDPETLESEDPIRTALNSLGWEFQVESLQNYPE